MVTGGIWGGNSLAENRCQRWVKLEMGNLRNGGRPSRIEQEWHVLPNRRMKAGDDSLPLFATHEFDDLLN